MIPHVGRGRQITAEGQNALIDQVNTNTVDISELQDGGGGTPQDPVVDWFSGEGPPAFVAGSGPGDMYVDTLTGTVYQLR